MISYGVVEENELHKKPPKFMHTLILEDAIPKKEIELLWDTGADFTRFHPLSVVAIPNEKITSNFEVEMYGHGSEIIKCNVCDIKISSPEGGSFGNVRVMIGGNLNGVIGRDIVLCFETIQNPKTNPPSMTYKRIYKQPQHLMFKDNPIVYSPDIKFDSN